MKSAPHSPFLRATVGLDPGAQFTALALSCVLLDCPCKRGPDYREPPLVDVGSGWSLPLKSESPVRRLEPPVVCTDDPILDRLMATGAGIGEPGSAPGCGTHR